MKHNKKKLPGRTERLAILVGAGFPNAQQLVDQRREFRAAADDVVDAMAMAWTAWRVANGNAVCQPSVHEVPIDAHHLKMQIWG
jgi:predicted RNase H-like nuclease